MPRWVSGLGYRVTCCANPAELGQPLPWPACRFPTPQASEGDEGPD